MKSVLYFPALLLFILALNACAPDIAYRDISEFQINPSALDNLEIIELLYASATPVNEEHLSYYIHAVGISKVTGDTINVLTTFHRGVGGGTSKNEFKYLSLNSPEGKAYFDKMYSENITGIPYNFGSISEINRVTYDRRFDYIAINNHPTVIGFLDK